MYNWSKSTNITYKRWGNSDTRGEANFVGQADEDQGTDNEICTVAAARVDSGGRKSPSAPTCDRPQETFTVDDALEYMGFGKFQWKMSLITGLAWIGDSMEMMILSILAPQLHCEWRLPKYEVALITSVVFIGMGVSSPFWGNLFDKYGRRTGLMLSMTWTLYFGLLSAFAQVYGWLLFLRGLVGFGLGGAPQAVTLYSEFLPTKARGSCVVLIAVFWSIGAVLEVLLALLIMPSHGWRWLLAISGLPVAIFICFSAWLPESPRFNILTGHTEKAMATLENIAKENGKTLPPGKIVALKQNDRGNIKELFSSQYRRTTLILYLIWFSFAFSYYGIVLLTTELFQSGESCGSTNTAEIKADCSLKCRPLTSEDYIDLLWTTLAEFPGLLVVVLLVDRIGRKKTMALCFLTFSLFILPLFICVGRVGITVLIFIARAFISGGFQVVFVYTPEVFPTENRALAMGTCSTMARVGSLITPFVSQVLLSTSVYVTLSVYIACSLLASIACLLLPLETMGRGLQESVYDGEAGLQTTTTPSKSSGIMYS